MAEGFKGGIGKGLQLSAGGKLVLSSAASSHKPVQPAPVQEKIFIPTPTMQIVAKPRKISKKRSLRIPKKLVAIPALVLMVSVAGVAYGLPLFNESTPDAQYKTLSTAAAKIPQSHVNKPKKAPAPPVTPTTPAVSKPSAGVATAKKSSTSPTSSPQALSNSAQPAVEVPGSSDEAVVTDPTGEESPAADPEPVIPPVSTPEEP